MVSHNLTKKLYNTFKLSPKCSKHRNNVLASCTSSILIVYVFFPSDFDLWGYLHL